MSSTSAFRRLLLCLDREAPDTEILRLGRWLKDASSAEVFVVTVIFRPTSVAADAADGAPASLEEAAIALRVRENVRGVFGEAASQIPVRVLHGDPAQRIVEHAEYLEADLIVLGGHRRTALGRLFRGSVSSAVVANARQAVLVVGMPIAPAAR